MRGKIILTFLLLVCAVSCRKPGPAPLPAELLVVDPSADLQPVIGPQGGEVSVSFTAADGWEASVTGMEADGWCTVSPLSGPAGQGTVNITVKGNGTYEDRFATVVITCRDASSTVKVTQKQTGNIALMSPGIELSSEGGDFNIEMMSNMPYDCVIGEDCRDWITAVQTKAYERSSVTFTASPNPGTLRREGTIDIMADGIRETFHVSQAGESPSVVLTASSYDVSPDGGILSIGVASNIDVSIQVEPGIDWITAIPTKSIVTSSFTFSIGPNGTTEARHACLAVQSADGLFEEKVLVSQAGREPVEMTGLSLDRESLVFLEGEVTVLIATVTPSDAFGYELVWSSSDESVVMVDGGTLTACSSGTATVTAATADGAFSASCEVRVEKRYVPVTGIALDRSSAALSEDDQFRLTATVTPSDASVKTVQWVSSNPRVASVEDGLVTALAEGTARIIATTEDGYHTAFCSVAVTKKIVHVSSVALDRTFMEMEEGQETALAVTVLPENATAAGVVWASSDETVATVSGGTVKALARGSATITATASDGGLRSGCNVSVKPRTIHVESIALDRTAADMAEGDRLTLYVQTTPSPVTNGTVSWSSSAPAVAIVANGEVTARSEGTAVITAVSNDGGHQAGCTVTVRKRTVPVTGLTLSSSSVELTEGESLRLAANVLPEDATDKVIVWSSDNSGVVTVENGILTAVSQGTATVRAAAGTGEASAVCTVTVRRKPVRVTGVSLDRAVLDLTEGMTATLTASVHPGNADKRDVTWSSDNPGVASVTDGRVTALAAGTATVTVTTADGGHTASCPVTVTGKVTNVSGMTIDRTELTIEEGVEAQLRASVTPSDADNTAVRWASSDETVATVSQDGMVRALKEGKASVSVTSVEGGFSASCSVTVKRKALTNERIGFEEW